MPGLPEQVAEFSFAAGLREHEDKWLQAEGFSEIENCIQEKSGALVKAPGWVSIDADRLQQRLGELSPVSAVPDAPKLIRLGSQVACVASGYLFALRSDDTWVLQGRLSPWVMDQRTIVDVAPHPDGYETVRHDCCRCGEYVYSVVEYHFDGSGSPRLQILVTHLPTGKTIAQEVTEADSNGRTHPRIVPWGETHMACLLYRREETTPEGYAELYYRQIDAESTSGSLDVIIGDEEPLVISGSTPISASAFDAVMDTDANGSYFWVAYHPSSAVSETVQSVYVYRWTFGASDLGASASHGYQETGLSGIPRAVALSASLASDRVCVAWAQTRDVGGSDRSDDVGVFKREADLTAHAFATQLVWSSNTFDVAYDLKDRRVHKLSVCEAGADNALMFFDPNPNSPLGGEYTGPAPTTRGLVVPDGIVGINPRYAGRVRLRSKIFFDGTRVCALMEHGSSDYLTDKTDENRYYVVMGFEPVSYGSSGRMLPYAHCAETQAARVPYLSSTNDPGHDFVTSVWEDDDGNPCLQALERDPGSLRLRLRAYHLKTDDRVARAAEFGGATYTAGALLGMWDGLRCHEAAWLARPFLEYLVQQTDTPNQGEGDRYYCVTFARTNAAGELLRSAPSPARLAAAASGEVNNLGIAAYCLSLITAGDIQSLWIEVWRTLDAQASPFWLVARIPLDLAQRETYTWLDTISDSEAPTLFGQTLPTDDQLGAELANDPPPPATHLAVHRGRLWLTDGAQLAYSKEQQPTRPAEFSLLQTLPAPETVAIGPLGDMLAVFRERGTAYVYGEGPAANGTGATLVGPVDLQTELGCTAPAGVAVIPEGLLVPTQRGLQVLNQQRSYKLVGLPIEDTLAEFPRVRDAEWECGTSRVWVALCTEAGTRGIFGLWDLEADTWSVVRYSQESGLGPSSVRSTPDALRWMTHSGLARVPSDEPELIAGYVGTTRFSQLITTPWMKPGGAIAEMRVRRVWLLGESLGASPLAIDVGYDYDDTWTHTVTFDAHSEGSSEPADDTWSSGGTTPAVISEVVDVGSTSAEDGVPHSVSGTADVEATDIGSYPVTVTALILVDGVIAITGESHTFSSIPDSRTLAVSGTVRPEGGQSIVFALELSGNGAELPFPTSFAFTNQAFTYEADDALATPMMLRIPLPKQRCHAVRFRIREDVFSGSGSTGFRFVAMRVLTAIRKAKGALKGRAHTGGGFSANGE